MLYTQTHTKGIPTIVMCVFCILTGINVLNKYSFKAVESIKLKFAVKFIN
jgi:hypothetical protein